MAGPGLVMSERPLAARYRFASLTFSVFDDFPAALGHDGGRPGADASQHLDLVLLATISGIAVVYETFSAMRGADRAHGRTKMDTS